MESQIIRFIKSAERIIKTILQKPFYGCKWLCDKSRTEKGLKAARYLKRYFFSFIVFVEGLFMYGMSGIDSDGGILLVSVITLGGGVLSAVLTTAFAAEIEKYFNRCCISLVITAVLFLPMFLVSCLFLKSSTVCFIILLCIRIVYLILAIKDKKDRIIIMISEPRIFMYGLMIALSCQPDEPWIF